MLGGRMGCGFGKGVSAPGITVRKQRRNKINMVKKNVKISDNETRTFKQLPQNTVLG
jgi:hypothetical protein